MKPDSIPLPVMTFICPCAECHADGRVTWGREDMVYSKDFPGWLGRFCLHRINDFRKRRNLPLLRIHFQLHEVLVFGLDCGYK